MSRLSPSSASPRLLALTLALAGTLWTLGCDDAGTDGAVDGSGDGTDAGGMGDDGQGGGDTGFGGFDPTVDAQFAGLTVRAPRFSTSGSDFYRMPWPNDYRTQESGAPELSDFPNPEDIALLDAYVEVIESTADGFSNLPVLYQTLDGPLAIDSLPTPAETLTPEGTVQLIQLTGTNACRERLPIEVTFIGEPEPYTALNTLRASTVNGWVLAPAETFAFVVLRTLGAEEGATIGVAQPFRDAVTGQSADARLNSAYAPLAACLTQLELDPALIATASVFTTQDPVRETRLMRQVALEQADAPRVVSFVLEEEYSNGTYTTFGGRYTTPIFQRGETPYAGIGDGGGLTFGEDGLPVIQRYEEVPFSIAYPTDAEGPLPVLLWEDGTAVGSASDRRVQFGHIGDDPFDAAIDRGFAVVNFQPQFHAGRSGSGADEVLHSFNFLNPESGRTAFRQQVVDSSYFVRLIRDHADQLTGIPELDTSRMVYGGHSQGAIIGSMLAAVDPSFDAFFLNGVGAVLGIVVVERKDPLDIAATLGGLLGTRQLDRFHPVVQLAQLGADPVDPANYVRYWKGWDTHLEGNHVLMTNGFNDDTTHHTQISAITIASGAGATFPLGWDLDPFGVWEGDSELLPIQGNRRSLAGTPLTLASYTDSETGHFTIYDKASIMRMGADFWLSAISGVPEVDR